jgi:predicted MFS family arabinose efflux permease
VAGSREPAFAQKVGVANCPIRPGMREVRRNGPRPFNSRPEEPFPGGARRVNSRFVLLMVVVFINIAGFSLILPLLPFYGRELNASPFEVACLFAAYSLGNVFGEIYWGRLSDKVGRKPILCLAMGAAALSYVAFAFASTLWLALAIRIVSGFFSGTMGVVQSYIADVSKPEERARSIGYFMAAFNLGFALGPALGGLLARPELGLAGFHRPILTAAAFAGAASVWAGFMLPESRAGGPMRQLPRWSEAARIVTASPLLVRLFAIAFIGIGAFASMESVFGLWTQKNFGWSTDRVGLTFIAVGLAGMVAQLFLIGPLSKRFGEARVIVGGLLVLAASMVLQPVLRDPLAAAALMSTLMMGHSLAFPSAGALVTRAIGPESQGSVNGLLMATNAVGRIVAPPFFGFAYSSIGPDSPYYLCAVLVGLAVIFALQAVRVREAQARAA